MGRLRFVLCSLLWVAGLGTLFDVYLGFTICVVSCFAVVVLL